MRPKRKGGKSWQTETNVQSLVCFTSHGLVAACLENGVAVLSAGTSNREAEVLHADLTSPLAAYTPDGVLVVVAGDNCHCSMLWDAREHRQFRLQGMSPLAVLPGPAAGQFIVFQRSGIGRLYQLERRE